jgi:uncharacterized repeat protein (TIGR01451 family)
MVERCQNLALRAEPLQHKRRVKSAPHQLDGHFLGVLAIGPDGAIDLAHSPATDFFHDLIHTDAAPGAHRSGWRFFLEMDGGRIQKSGSGLFVRSEKRLADAAESGGATATIQGGSTLTGVGIADVAVFLSTTPNPGQVGAPLTYSVTAYNIGDDDAQNVVVSLVLPPKVTFVSASKGCTHSVTLVNCKIGHMVVSGSKTVNLTVLPTLSGWTYATALLRGETVADPSALDNSAASRIWVNP